MTMAPKVCIITVTCNSASFIEECLIALNSQIFRDFKVILVDNDSSDQTLGVIESLRPELAYPLDVIPLNSNTGFTGGNLEGYRHARGKYIALLNPDTVADAQWLGELVRVMDANPQVGICASLLINHSSGLIDTAGDGFSTALKGLKRGEGEPPENFTKQEPVFGACAGAALYRQSMLDEIGFLDDDFFLIYEDTDMNLRAQLAGWRVMYVPSAKVLHKVRSTIVHLSPNAVYYSVRNSGLVRLKNIPLLVFLYCLPSVLIAFIAEFVYFVIRHGRPILYLKAKFGMLMLLPRMLRKRRKILRNLKVTNSYIIDIMTPALQKDFMFAKFKKLIKGE